MNKNNRYILFIFFIFYLFCTGCSPATNTKKEEEEKIINTSVKLLEYIKYKNYSSIKNMYYKGDIDLYVSYNRFTSLVDELSGYMTDAEIDKKNIELTDENERQFGQKYKYEVRCNIFDNDSSKLAITIQFLNEIGPQKIAFFGKDMTMKKIDTSKIDEDFIKAINSIKAIHDSINNSKLH